MLTFDDVMAVSTVKCNYEAIDNETRKTESAKFSFRQSVPYLQSYSKRELLAYNSAQSKGLYFSL
jgi:hypothetical protein